MSKAINWKSVASSLDAFAEASHWYVGFSGGVDSTALLHMLRRWRKSARNPPPLTALHVNHGLQAQSADWENHCAWICRFLDVDFLSLQATVRAAGGGPEADARQARYALFESQLDNADVLFLGHHQDDQVETFFLRLLRGAGVDGLGAIPAQRALGKGQLYRPLLECSRNQLQHYVAGNGLRSIDDPSNEDIQLDRNYLRQEVLPVIAKRWPGYRKTVTRASEHIGATSNAIDQGMVLPELCHSVLGDPGLPLSFLDESDDQQCAQVIRAWLRRQGLQMPDRSLLAEFLRQLRKSGRRTRPMLDAGDYRLQRYREVLYRLPTLPKLPASTVAPVVIAPGQTLDIEGVGRVTLQRCAAPGIWLAADEELELRWRTGGERLRQPGRKRSTELKKVLQEAAIPPWWRDRLPLLYLEEQLLAVGELGPCQSARWGQEGQEAEAPWEFLWEPAVSDGFH